MNWLRLRNICVLLILEIIIVLSLINSMEVYLRVTVHQQSAIITTLNIAGSGTQYNSDEINQSFEVDAGTQFTILFNNTAAIFDGTIIIEGYENPITNVDQSFWHNNSGQDIYKYPSSDDKYYFEKGYDRLVFTIPTLEQVQTMDHLGWGRYSYRFNCMNTSFEVDYNVQTPLPLSSMVVKSKSQLLLEEPREIKFYSNPNNFHGNFSDSEGYSKYKTLFSCEPPSSLTYISTAGAVKSTTVSIFSRYSALCKYSPDSFTI